MPTLFRSLLPFFAYRKGSRGAAFKANKTEQEITSFFVKKFFESDAARQALPNARKIGIPRRAAIARHYGFYSWFLDFTSEPGIAAFFATGGAGRPVRDGVGAISVLDEGLISRQLGAEPTIAQSPGYQSRSWSGARTADVFERYAFGPDLNGLGSQRFRQSFLRSPYSRNGLSLTTAYTPGPDIERMWRQRWCGVAPSSDLWPTNVEGRYNTMLVMERMWSTLLFEQNGQVYEETDQLITAHDLFPNDAFTEAVEAFKLKHRLAPGAATAALWDKYM